MIIDYISNSEFIESLHEGFRIAFNYLKNNDMMSLPIGKVFLEKGVYISIEEINGKQVDTAKYESHRKYIDIQFPISTGESYGWKMLEENDKMEDDYDEDRDIVFYEESVSQVVSLDVGQFVVFFPQDLHAPCILKGKLKKAVAKIPINL